jgi:hypothetical protein
LGQTGVVKEVLLEAVGFSSALKVEQDLNKPKIGGKSNQAESLRLAKSSCSHFPLNPHNLLERKTHQKMQLRLKEWLK